MTEPAAKSGQPGYQSVERVHRRSEPAGGSPPVTIERKVPATEKSPKQTPSRPLPRKPSLVVTLPIDMRKQEEALALALEARLDMVDLALLVTLLTKLVKRAQNVERNRRIKNGSLSCLYGAQKGLAQSKLEEANMELKSAVNDWRTLCGVPTVAPKPRQFRPSNQLKKIVESFERHVDRDDIDRVGAPKLSKADKIDRSGLKATKLRLEIDQQLVEIWRKGELLNRERQLAQWKRAKKAKAAAKKATKRPSEKTFPGAKRSPPASKSTSPSDTGELNRHKKAIELTARASVLTDAETYSLNPNEENKEKFRKTVDYFRQCKGEISPLFAKMRTCYSKAVFGELVSVLEGKEFLL